MGETSLFTLMQRVRKTDLLSCLEMKCDYSLVSLA